MLEVGNFYTKELSSHLLIDLFGKNNLDTQHVLLYLKFHLKPGQFILADLLAVFPSILLLASLEGAMLSLFISASTHHWHLLLGFPYSQVALGGQVQRIHVAADSNFFMLQTICAGSGC